MSDAVKSEYRIVYNWGKGAHEVCEIWSVNNEKPHAYAEVPGVGTSDDDPSLGDDPDPVTRVRNLLTDLLTACDKPILKFPEDFDA